MTARRPRIGFLSRADALSRRPQSGVFYFMGKALQKHCGDVVFLGPHEPVVPDSRNDPSPSAAAAPAMSGGRYDAERTRAVSEAHARHFGERLREENVDLIFAPNASTEIAFLETPHPIIYLSDATLGLLNGYYENFTNLANFAEVDDIERRAIRKARLLIYRSAWAAGSAVRDYGADPSRVHAIPNGANIDEPPEAADVLGRKKGLVCRLLFLGVDWERKGGDLAYQTMVHLNEAGVTTELIVCGCRPSCESVEGDARVTVIPFRDKDIPGHRQLLENLFRAADFLVVPTRADCFLNAACEASAYGIPAIVTDTGGVSAAVENGQNGYRLPLEAGAHEYANLIEKLYCDRERYDQLARSSRQVFETRLNWDTWALTLRDLLCRSFSTDPAFR